MRDPVTHIDDPIVAAAIKETRDVLGVWQALRGLRDGLEYEARIRTKARAELTRSDIKASLSDDVFRYLWRFVLPTSQPKLRGRPRNTIRDQILVNMIAHIKERHGIYPTRNRDSMHDYYSCCAIVSQVLVELGIELEEVAVEEVWRRMGHRARPDKSWRPKILGLTREEVESLKRAEPEDVVFMEE
jgi:hypothetical protein